MYKLKQFEHSIVKFLSDNFTDKLSFQETVDYYERNNEYYSLELSFIWALWRTLCRKDNWELYDEIHEKFPDVCDNHIITLFRKAIKELYGNDITTLLEIFRDA